MILQSGVDLDVRPLILPSVTLRTLFQPQLAEPALHSENQDAPCVRQKNTQLVSLNIVLMIEIPESPIDSLCVLPLEGSVRNSVANSACRAI